MEQGKFQDRVRLVTGELVRFLRQYSTPPQLDNDVLELERVRITAEAINAELPADISPEGVRDKMMGMFSELRKSYRAQQWPAPAHFVDALEKAKHRRRPEAALLSDGTISAKRSELPEDQRNLLEQKILPTARRGVKKLALGDSLFQHGMQTLEYWDDLGHPDIQQKLADVKSLKHRRECRDPDCPVCEQLNAHIPQDEIDHNNRIMAELLNVKPDTPPSRAKAERKKTVADHGYTDEELLAYCKANPVQPRQETLDSIASKT